MTEVVSHLIFRNAFLQAKLCDPILDKICIHHFVTPLGIYCYCKTKREAIIRMVYAFIFKLLV